MSVIHTNPFLVPSALLERSVRSKNSSQVVLPYRWFGASCAPWRHLLGGVFLVSLFVERDGSFDDIRGQAGGSLMLLGISLGITVYAATSVFGRILMIAMTPTPRRDARQGPSANRPG